MNWSISAPASSWRTIAISGFIELARAGVYATMFDPDIPTPMIAARDVGDVAATILSEEHVEQPRIRELLGPRDYTMREATRLLAAAVDLDDLRYQQLSYEDGQRRIVAAGASPSFAAAVAQTARSFNAREAWHLERRNARNTTPTTLEAFAHDTIRPAFPREVNGH